MALPEKWNVKIESFFIKEVQKYPELWQATHYNFSKKGLKKFIYGKMCKSMKERWPNREGFFTAEVLHRKFGMLKSQYIREKRKMKNLPSWCGGEGFKTKWVHYHALTYLDNVDPCFSTLDRMSTEEIVIEPDVDTDNFHEEPFEENQSEELDTKSLSDSATSMLTPDLNTRNLSDGASSMLTPASNTRSLSDGANSMLTPALNNRSLSDGATSMLTPTITPAEPSNLNCNEDSTKSKQTKYSVKPSDVLAKEPVVQERGLTDSVEDSFGRFVSAKLKEL